MWTFWASPSCRKHLQDQHSHQPANHRKEQERERKACRLVIIQSLDQDCEGWGTDMWREISTWNYCCYCSIFVPPCHNFWLIYLAVRRWADKFCLQCNIFIYIRHIWKKLVLCSHMVSLFHHISPWTHRCLQFSPSSLRNGRVFRRSVQTTCCYWILNRGKSSSNWNSQMNASRLWWAACWCEYSKTLRKAVQRWRIGAIRFEWQNMKDGFQKLVQRWRKCIEVCGDFVEK